MHPMHLIMHICANDFGLVVRLTLAAPNLFLPPLGDTILTYLFPTCASTKPIIPSPVTYASPSTTFMSGKKISELGFFSL